MKLFFDTKKKTMPQQVKRNEEDIETLKKGGFFVKPRGEYDATKTYHKFDLVSYDGDSYIFVSETDAVGIPVTNEDYWQLYTSGGLNIEIGTTETLPAGSNAVVTNTGSSTDAVLNFGIPKGDKGDKGYTGAQGEKGDTGATGATGAQGPIGPQGPAGADGVGVASGGTTGQVLKKKSNTDYDTEWANDTAGMENPMTSMGAMIYGGPTGDPLALTKGTAGQVLTMKQDETGPEWANASGEKLYKHTIKMNNSTTFLAVIEIINKSNTAITSSVNISKAVYESGGSASSNSDMMSCTGHSRTRNAVITGVGGFSDGSTLSFTGIEFYISNGVISSGLYSYTSYIGTVTDTITEL